MTIIKSISPLFDREAFTIEVANVVHAVSDVEHPFRLARIAIDRQLVHVGTLAVRMLQRRDFGPVGQVRRRPKSEGEAIVGPIEHDPNPTFRRLMPEDHRVGFFPETRVAEDVVLPGLCTVFGIGDLATLAYP